MPSKSKAQLKFMKMLEHNPEIAKEHGISPEKAKEFTEENIGKNAYSHLPEKIKEPRFKKLFKK